MTQTQPFGSFPPPRRYSLHGLATALTVMLVIFIVLDVAAAALFYWRGTLFASLSDGESVAEGTANLADGLDLIHWFLWLLLWIAVAVVFIIWQFRHARNAATLGVHGGLASPGWAIGGWFIPLANFVLPALQIFRSSRTPGAAPNSDATAVIVLWAVAFGAKAVVEGVASGVQTMGLSAEDVDLLATTEQVRTVAAVVEIVAAALAIVMVRMLTKRQGAAFDTWVTQETPWPRQVTA